MNTPTNPTIDMDLRKAAKVKRAVTSTPSSTNILEPQLPNKSLLKTSKSQTSVANIPRCPSKDDLSLLEKRKDKLLDEHTIRKYKYKKVISELIETESKFVNILFVIHNYFAKPLKEKQILSNQEIEMIFSNYFTIYKLQTNFYKQLILLKGNNFTKNYKLENFDDYNFTNCETIPQLFVEYSKQCSIFTVYCSNHSELVTKKIITNLQTSNKKFNRFLQEQFELSEVNRQTLQSLLTSIPQRICKYPLLLKQIISSSTKDIEQLENSLKMLDQVLNEINDNTQVSSDIGMLIEISKNLSFSKKYASFKLIEPERVFIYRGSFPIMDPHKDYGNYGILFSDILVLCSFQENQKYKVKRIIYLYNIISCESKSKIIQIAEVSSSLFSVEFQSESLLNQWLIKLKKTLQTSNNLLLSQKNMDSVTLEVPSKKKTKLSPSPSSTTSAVSFTLSSPASTEKPERNESKNSKIPLSKKYHSLHRKKFDKHVSDKNLSDFPKGIEIEKQKRKEAEFKRKESETKVKELEKEIKKLHHHIQEQNKVIELLGGDPLYLPNQQSLSTNSTPNVNNNSSNSITRKKTKRLKSLTANTTPENETVHFDSTKLVQSSWNILKSVKEKLEMKLNLEANESQTPTTSLHSPGKSKGESSDDKIPMDRFIFDYTHDTPASPVVDLDDFGSTKKSRRTSVRLPVMEITQSQSADVPTRTLSRRKKQKVKSTEILKNTSEPFSLNSPHKPIPFPSSTNSGSPKSGSYIELSSSTESNGSSILNTLNDLSNDIASSKKQRRLINQKSSDHLLNLTVKSENSEFLLPSPSSSSSSSDDKIKSSSLPENNTPSPRSDSIVTSQKLAVPEKQQYSDTFKAKKVKARLESKN